MEKLEYPSLRGKTVLITGASSGIGATTAVEFSKLGTNLVLGGRNIDNLEKTKKMCINEGLKSNQVVLVAGDIADESVRNNLIESAVSNFNELNILVNNAGIGVRVPIADLTTESFDKIFEVNLRASLALTLIALPYLVKSKGSIVNVSSIASYTPLSNSVPYCVSKACMDNMTKGLAFELASQGVRVNSVNPGGVPTNIMRYMDPEEIAKMFQNIKRSDFTPIGRSGTTKEIADAIIFLASDEASFITGHLLSACGGAGLHGVKI